MSRLMTILAILLAIAAGEARAEPMKVGVFAVDASPPAGSPLMYDPNKRVEYPLSCKGVVLIGEGKPVVLVALDWIGVANDGQTAFKKAIAEAAATEPNRVAVHALHQHDAPICDFTADRVLAAPGINGQMFDSAFARDVIARTAEAVRSATATAQPVTHLGLGQGEVQQVASNRRILGPNGKVKYVRYTACREPVVRDAPVGTIDPMLKLISFWNGDKPIAALTYYATHPQSYYRTGLANPDFPGMAREDRQRATGCPHIHFDGAGGNIGAGKYNDGSKPMRRVLADRVAEGMARAWESTVKTPISAAELGWETVAVALPPARHLDESKLSATMNDPKAPIRDRLEAGRALVWLRRCRAGETIDVSCLRLGRARVLHLPGELFVEYQLAAQAMRPDLFVAMAAYGEYAPGYIGTEAAYPEGGYETGPKASLVAPEVEGVLMSAIGKLLEAPVRGRTAPGSRPVPN